MFLHFSARREWTGIKNFPQHTCRPGVVAVAAASPSVRRRTGPARASAGGHSLRKISVPLVPPKPNELDKTTSIFISRAVWGT